MSSTVFYESASELATLSNTFKVNSVPTDPTTVSLTITTPSGTVTTYTYAAAQITKTSTGVYTKDIACSEDGEWQYVWTGTTAAADVEAGTWTVFESDLGKLYWTPAALKNRVRITNTNQDYEIPAACFAASRAIEQACERTFYRTASATVRTFVPSGMYELKLGPYNDLVSLATLKTDTAGDGSFATTWAGTDYQLLPLNPGAAPEVRPYTKIKAVLNTFPVVTGFGRDDRVQLTGVFGWPAVPWAVKKATQLLAEEMLKDAPFGVAGIGDFGVVRVRENPRIKALIGPYIHPIAASKVA